MKGKNRKKAIICSLALIACNLSVTAAEFLSLGVKVVTTLRDLPGPIFPVEKKAKVK